MVNDIWGWMGPKASWHLSYRWGKTPKRAHPGNLPRPGIEPRCAYFRLLHSGGQIRTDQSKMSKPQESGISQSSARMQQNYCHWCHIKFQDCKRQSKETLTECNFVTGCFIRSIQEKLRVAANGGPFSALTLNKSPNYWRFMVKWGRRAIGVSGSLIWSKTLMETDI